MNDKYVLAIVPGRDSERIRLIDYGIRSYQPEGVPLGLGARGKVFRVGIGTAAVLTACLIGVHSALCEAARLLTTASQMQDGQHSTNWVPRWWMPYREENVVQNIEAIRAAGSGILLLDDRFGLIPPEFATTSLVPAPVFAEVLYG